VLEDDGAGFDPGAIRGDGLGLVGMRERAVLIGGLFEIESAPGKGTTIYVRVPFRTVSEGS
jgi:signal transduction histidine kinase